MTTPGVTTIPRETTPAPNPKMTVLPAGVPKVVRFDRTTDANYQVEILNDGWLHLADKITIRGESVLVDGEVRTTAEIVLER